MEKKRIHDNRGLEENPEDLGLFSKDKSFTKQCPGTESKPTS